jgi:hypothetical protein
MDTTILLGVKYEEGKPETYKGITIGVIIRQPTQQALDAIVNLCKATEQHKITDAYAGKTPEIVDLELRAYTNDPVEDWSFVRWLISHWSNAIILNRSSVDHFVMDGGTLDG